MRIWMFKVGNMAMKNIFDKYTEKRDTKKVLYSIGEKINGLSNIMTNKSINMYDRFIGEYVDFKMFLEKIKNDSLQDLIKDLQEVNKKVYNYVNQESYVKNLKRVYNDFSKEFEKADVDKSKESQKNKLDVFKSSMKTVKKEEVKKRSLKQFMEDMTKSK